MSRSVVFPAATVRPPPAIWLVGILIPVLSSLERFSVWKLESFESWTQLADPLPQALVPMLALSRRG